MAFSQLPTGPGKLLRQTGQLRELGARNSRQLYQKLIEQVGGGLEEGDAED